MQEEARRALQGLFKDKKDSLAAFDISPGYEGGGGGGARGKGKKSTGGGDNGKGGWQAPDWKHLGLNAWRRLGKSFRAILAILAFIGTALSLVRKH